MNIEQIDFGSFLTYSLRGNTEGAKNSKTLMSNLKCNQYIGAKSNSVLTSDCLAGSIKKK